MRKSKVEAAATRDRIVSAAGRVFLEKGLGSVGMRDLMEAAELTPGGFYRHFSSKEQLTAEVLRAAFDRLLAMLEKEVTGKPKAKALDRIVTLYLRQSHQPPDGGVPYRCPLAQLGAELRHSAPEVRSVGFEGYQRLAALIVRCLDGTPKRQAAATASAVVSIMVGAVTLAGLAPDRSTAARILRQAKGAIRERYGRED